LRKVLTSTRSSAANLAWLSLVVAFATTRQGPPQLPNSTATLDEIASVRPCNRVINDALAQYIGTAVKPMTADQVRKIVREELATATR